MKICLLERDENYTQRLKETIEQKDEIQLDCVPAIEAAHIHRKNDLDRDFPDLLVMDIPSNNPIAFNHLSFLKEQCPEVPFLIISDAEAKDRAYLDLIFRSGASGLLHKDSPSHLIYSKIMEISNGEIRLPAIIAESVLRTFRNTANGKHFKLTDREKEVLYWMSEGLSQKRIAKAMYISPYTVNTHVQNIYLKLKVNSGVQAVAKALKKKII